jgi:WD40 repeat protein/beta-lactamase regulating signal transducer with metallopeptidase domain
MSTLLAIGLANAACAAVLAIPALLASRYGRRPALAHALWLLVLVKLITPPLVRPSLPWLPVEQEPAAMAPREQPSRAPAAVAEAQPAEPLPAVVLGLAAGELALRDRQEVAPKDVSPPPPAPSQPARERPAQAAGAALPPLAEASAPAVEREAVAPVADAAESPVGAHDLVFFLTAVWLLGGAACLARTLFYTARFQHLLRHARVAPEHLQQQARDLARRMGLGRCPEVWLLPGALPPLVWSAGRARILFPAGLLERLDRDERASLIAHELGHVVRLDHWVRWLELVVLALYWWYPLAWYARRQMQEREEECCDAHAAAACDARTYAGAILTTLDFLAELRPALPAVVSPLAGVASIRQRLTLIMTGGTPRRLSGPARLGVLALFVGVLPLPVLTPALAEKKARSTEAEKPAAAPPAAPADEAPEPTEYDGSGINLVGASDEVFSVDVSPDGRFLAAGSGNVSRPGEVEIYDVRSRKLVAKAPEMRGVASVRFAPDSKRLSWSGWDGIARLADLTLRKPAFSVRLQGNHRVALSRDGKWLAAAGENRGLRLLRASDGKLTHLFRAELPHFYCIEFSHDSRFLAAGGSRYQGRTASHFALVFDVLEHKQVAKLEGHTGSILNVAFGPRDEVLATSGADNVVRLWDAKSWKLRAQLNGHTGAVKGLAFSPDGKTLATGSVDKTIRLWNVITGEALGQLEGHPGAVREIAFSGDGKLLVSGGAQHSLRLWDVEGMKELATLREAPDPAEDGGNAPLVMALAPSGKWLATGGENGEVVLRDPATGEVVRKVKCSDDAVTTLAFSPDGKTLAASGPDGLVKLLDPATGKELKSLKGEDPSWIYSLAFAPDGKAIAAGSYDKTVHVWPLAGGAARKLTGHKANVRAVAFSPDGSLLASGSSDRTVRLWDLKTFTSKQVLKGHEGSVRGVRFAPDGRTLASVGEDGFLFLWDPDTGKERLKVKAHDGETLSLAWSPAGRSIVTGGGNGRLRFWDPVTGKMRSERYAHAEGVTDVAFGPGARQLFSLGAGRWLTRWQSVVSPVRTFEGHTGPVNTVSLSRDGKRLLSCGSWPEGDKTLRLWDVATGKELRTFTAPGNPQFQSNAFSPDGKHAFAGGEDGRIWEWDLDTGKLLREIKGHKGAVACLTFSPDGKKLATASHDNTVRLWDVATGETERVFTGHTSWARRVAFLPDGKRLLSGGRDKMLRLWDIASGDLLRSINHRDAWVESIVPTRDGKQVLTCGGDDVLLWDLEKGEVLRTFVGHAFGVTCVILTRDERQALSCSYDGSVRLWDVASGAEVQRFTSHRSFVWSVALTPDGRHFLSGGGGTSQGNGTFAPGTDFAVRLWQMPGR